jgi:hypothetical protein
VAEDKIYVTIDKNPRGPGVLAVISQGQPQLGDQEVTILTFEVLPNRKAAKQWFRRMKVERPWEIRN